MLLDIPISLSACILKQLLSVTLWQFDCTAAATVSFSFKVRLALTKSDKLFAKKI